MAAFLMLGKLNNAAGIALKTRHSRGREKRVNIASRSSVWMASKMWVCGISN